MIFILFLLTNQTKDIFHLKFPIFKISRLLTIGDPVKTLSIGARLWSSSRSLFLKINLGLWDEQPSSRTIFHWFHQISAESAATRHCSRNVKEDDWIKWHIFFRLWSRRCGSGGTWSVAWNGSHGIWKEMIDSNTKFKYLTLHDYLDKYRVMYTNVSIKLNWLSLVSIIVVMCALVKSEPNRCRR